MVPSSHCLPVVVLLLLVACLLFPTAAAASSVSSSPSSSLPWINVPSGLTPFQRGEHLGSARRQQNQEYMTKNADQMESLRKFAHAHPSAIRSIQSATHHLIPDVYEELRGVASGSGLDFASTVGLLMMRPEIGLLARLPEDALPADRECTDLGMLGSTSAPAGSGWLGHNEDADPLTGDFATMVHFPHFRAYCYPALAPGNAWGWTRASLAISVNAVSPKTVNLNGAARYALNRYLLDSKSLADLIHRIETVPIASGCSVNVLDFSPAPPLPPNILNIEVAPPLNGSKNEVSIRQLSKTDPWYGHANVLLRLQLPQYKGDSSIHRDARLDQLGPDLKRLGIQEVQNVLGDQQDRQWPIFRDCKPPDSGKTISSVIFDAAGRKASIWWLASPILQPANATEPL